MEKIALGIIGAGRVAELSHLPNLLTMPEIDVVGISDVNEARAQEIAKRFNIPSFYSDYSELMETVDAVDICVPNFLHMDVAEEALERDLHILCEKPLSHSLEEARRIEKKLTPERVFMQVFNHRFKSQFMLLKKLMEKDLIGRVERVEMVFKQMHPMMGWKPLTKFSMDKTKAGGGCLIDFGPHKIDLMRWFFGEPVGISKAEFDYRYQDDLESDALVEFEYPDFPVIFETGWTDRKGIRDYIGIEGEDGFLVCDGFGGEIELKTDRRVIGGRGSVHIKAEDDHLDFHRQFKSFADSILYGRQVVTSFDDGLKTLELITRAYEAR